MRNRVKEIEQRNYFKMMTGNSDTNHCQTNTGFQGMPPIDFNKIRVGAQTLEDAIIEIGLLKKVNPRLADKKLVLDAINKGYNCNESGELESVGEMNPNAKLTEEDVILIRKYYNEKTLTQKEVYELFKDKISFHSFQAIWQGKV